MGETRVPTDPGWYYDPEGRFAHQAYWDGEKWTGATRLPFGRIKGANRAAIASVYFGGAGGLLTILGWSIQGSLLEGEGATALMIGGGMILGVMALILWFTSFVAGSNRDARITIRARRYGLLLGLVALSPVFYIALLIGALAQGL